ncbi:hypothetical protein BN946_scf184908.g45 [Trametes cinnabarina]|uniref:Uncharacterized protein n=1 Tax=Pycnoporus cinnabarinus TaxID=5643 RepID=A0A060SFZ2_PYCCI|nr:hypothetical protein BN946_scf184908.g45 [Trametes cinnabarina]
MHHLIAARILPKLNAEADAHLGPGGPANAKKGTLDVHRGDTYQFGYFLRGTEPHAVLIKTRIFTAAPKPAARTVPPVAASSSRPQLADGSQAAGRKRKPKPRPKGKGKARAAEDDAISISSEDEANHARVPSESVTVATRRSKRARNVPSGGYAEDVGEAIVDEVLEDVRDDDYAMGGEQPMDATPIVPKREETELSLGDIPVSDAQIVPEHEAPESSAMYVEFVDDEEEEKPKPVLKLKYHGFTIHGRCLCVIVEPYPPIRSGTRAPSLAPTGLIAPRAPSIAPPDFVPSGGAVTRERTPLFLPDFDRDPTPAPTGVRNLPPVPLFNEAAEGSDDDDDGGMVLFSQILRSVGDHPPGIAEDEDEIDGAVFFGDADETREL